MTCSKSILKLAVAACLLAVSAPAWACYLTGSVVCSTDPTIPVPGITVTFTKADGTQFTLVSGADGSFSGHLSWNTTYDVSYTAEDAVCNELGQGVSLAPIEVYDAAVCPVPACLPTIPAGMAFPYCPARPIGNPRAECGLFGLTVLDKAEGAEAVASNTAPLAIVKAGRCYGIAVGVEAGDPIVSPTSQAVSHVTYCTCK